MTRMNYFATTAAVVATFVASSVRYSPLAFGKELMELSGIVPNAGKIIGELVRTATLPVCWRLFVLLKVVAWKSALPLGILLWIGFHVVLLFGSVMWQNIPWILAAIHASGWFVKILLISLIVGGW